MRFHQRRPALWPWPALAQVLPWRFRRFFLTCRLIAATRFWLSPRVSTPPSRCQNTVPAPSGGPITLDDATFTTKIAVHSVAGVLAPLGCVTLLDTGSPQTFIRRDVLDRMQSVGAAFIASEQKCAPRSWGGGRESAPLKTSPGVRLIAQLFRAN